MQQAPKPSISARHSGCFYKSKYSTPQKKLVDKSCRKWRGKAGLWSWLFSSNSPFQSAFIMVMKFYKQQNNPIKGKSFRCLPFVSPFYPLSRFGKLVLYFAAGIVPGSLGLYHIIYSTLRTWRDSKLKSNYKLKNRKRLWKRKKFIWLRK